MSNGCSSVRQTWWGRWAKVTIPEKERSIDGPYLVSARPAEGQRSEPPHTAKASGRTPQVGVLARVREDGEQERECDEEVHRRRGVGEQRVAQAEASAREPDERRTGETFRD